MASCPHDKRQSPGSQLGLSGSNSLLASTDLDRTFHVTQLCVGFLGQLFGRAGCVLPRSFHVKCFAATVLLGGRSSFPRETSSAS
jgi:hypothetical protein